jgi:hypothetical protein
LKDTHYQLTLPGEQPAMDSHLPVKDAGGGFSWGTLFLSHALRRG